MGGRPGAGMLIEVLARYPETVDVTKVSGMAETTGKKFSWKLFMWLSILFAIGNLIFTNLFLQLMGFAGLPMGLMVSGSMTLMVAFFVMRQRESPAESSKA